MANSRFRIRRTPEGGVSLGYSAYGSYRECARLAFWKYLAGGEGITPKADEPSEELLYGKLWHALYRGRHLGKPDLDVINESLTEDGLTIETATIMTALGANETGYAALADRLRADMDWYQEQLKDIRINVLHCEEELALKRGQHELRGSPDLIAELEGSWGGGIYVVDHKTYKMLTKDGRVYAKPNDATIQRHLHSRQFPLYMGLWTGLHPDQPCKDGLVNMVPQEALRVIAHQSTRKGVAHQPQVHREFIFHNADFVERTIADGFAACEELKGKLDYLESFDPSERLTVAMGTFGENGHACIGAWGRSCSYLGLCEARNDAIPSLMKAAYEGRKFA